MHIKNITRGELIGKQASVYEATNPSMKGINGGFFFNQAKENLPLKKVIVSIEGDSLFSGCGFGLKHCDENNPCPLHFSYAPIRDAINNLVLDETIQGLAKKYNEDDKIILSRINLIVPNRK